jgi:hypothetical protein
MQIPSDSVDVGDRVIVAGNPTVSKVWLSLPGQAFDAYNCGDSLAQ